MSSFNDTPDPAINALAPNGEQTYLGYWQGTEWWLEPTNAQVYRQTASGLRWEGSYAWFTAAAADRINTGDDHLV